MPLRLITLTDGVWRDDPPWPESDLRQHLGDLVNFLDKHGDTMIGTLALEPTDPDDPAMTTTAPVFVQADPSMVPTWDEPDPIDPPFDLLVNGSALLWSEENPDSAIILQAPTGDGTYGPRIRLLNPNTGSADTAVPTLEFQTHLPGTPDDKADCQLALLGQEDFTLRISSPSTPAPTPGGSSTFQVEIIGNLTVSGTINGHQYPARSSVADIGVETVAELAAANVEADTDAELGNVLSRLTELTSQVEEQARTIAAMSVTIAELSDRVRALEED